MADEENVTSSTPVVVLTEEMKAQIEKKRLKAIERKKQKLVVHPYAKRNGKSPPETNSIKVANKKVIDTGGGFLLDEPDDDIDHLLQQEFVEDPPPILFNQPECIECGKPFAESYLLKTFDYNVCDSCRDDEEKHALITKTSARATYMLKDCDFDKREPILKFIIRKNPHNPRWGEMKLYLEPQIKARAIEVWGSEEAITDELEKLEEKRVVTKAKKYRKEMKALRMKVRSSLYDKTSKASHTHEFGAETHVEDDTYKRTCSTCNYEETFEKM